MSVYYRKLTSRRNFTRWSVIPIIYLISSLLCSAYNSNVSNNYINFLIGIKALDKTKSNVEIRTLKFVLLMRVFATFTGMHNKDILNYSLRLINDACDFVK